MMPGGSASRWPVLLAPGLTNLQDGRLNLPPAHSSGYTLIFTNEKRGSKTLLNRFGHSATVLLP
jgi:hypothetical protein